MRGTIKDGTYYKMEKESGKLKKFGKFGSWTINLAEYNPISDFNIHTVVFTTNKRQYTISAKDVRDRGWKQQFKGEDKFIVPIHHWAEQEII